MNRELLEKPFGPEQIKQREGNFGKKLDYIEGHAVIQRLNEAFDSEWSFSILKHEIIKESDEVVVLGELKTGGIIKTQFGSSRITRARETGEMISIADDLKSAGTDALKKCATMLGVGLHLYNRGANSHPRHNGNSGNGYHARRYENDPPDDHPAGGHRKDNTGNGGDGNGTQSKGGNNGNGNGYGDNHPPQADRNGRLSGKQYKYLMMLNEERGRNKSDLDRFCLEAYGCGVEFLSKHDASTLIKSMMPN